MWFSNTWPKIIKLNQETSFKSQASDWLKWRLVRCLRFETGLQSQFYDLGPSKLCNEILLCWPLNTRGFRKVAPKYSWQLIQVTLFPNENRTHFITPLHYRLITFTSVIGLWLFSGSRDVLHVCLHRRINSLSKKHKIVQKLHS
jgi:hypothetical protein